MTKPVNLNRFRKEKARGLKKARADENSVKFGRTKAEKANETANAKLETRKLDSHRRDDQDPNSAG